jgi:hypothetical protein
VGGNARVTSKVLGNFEDKIKNEIRQLAILACNGFFKSVNENLLSTGAATVQLNEVRVELRRVVDALQHWIEANGDLKMTAVKARYRFLEFYEEFEAEVNRQLDAEYVLLHDRC